MQQYECANCGGPITVMDNVEAGGRGLITVNVNGHAKPAHAVCPTKEKQ